MCQDKNRPKDKIFCLFWISDKQTRPQHEGSVHSSRHAIPPERTKTLVFVFVFVLAHEQAISTCISQEGEFVDCSDECGEVVLVVGCVDEVFQSVEFGGVDLSVPLQFVLALLNHGPQVRTLVHPTGERLLEAGSSNLQRVGAEADQVKVPGGEGEDSPNNQLECKTMNWIPKC